MPTKKTAAEPPVELEKMDTEKVAARRELILRAASECFARHGFDKTTLDDIGRRAGLNKASLYYYFKNKEAVFIAVVLAETNVFAADLMAKTAKIDGVSAKTRFYLLERIRRYREVLNLNQLSIEALSRLEPVFDKLYETVKTGERAFLQTLLEAGQIADAPAVAEHLFFISDAFKHEAIRDSRAHLASEIDFAEAEKRLDWAVSRIFEALLNDEKSSPEDELALPEPPKLKKAKPSPKA